jgi:hypothetical protein
MKADAAPSGRRITPALPWTKGGVSPRDHPDLHVAARQYLVQPFVAGASEEALDGVVDFVPLLLEELLAGLLSSVDGELIEIRVADDPDLADCLDFLVDQIEDRRPEVAGDPQILRGALELILKVDVRQTVKPGREPLQVPARHQPALALYAPGNRPMGCGLQQGFGAAAQSFSPAIGGL